MSMLTMTAASLGQQIGQVVPDLYVTIAKNSIVGMDANQIADILGVTPQEIQDVQADQTYRDVRLLLAAEYAKTQIESDFTWDMIESAAVQGLAKRVPLERDTDTLLRIAAVANKAQRRNAVNNNKVLDPSQGGTRVALTLTSRITERLRNGRMEREETRQISVVDGSAQNPKFEDIDQLLGVSRKPALPDKMGIRTHEPDFTLDDLEFRGK